MWVAGDPQQLHAVVLAEGSGQDAGMSEVLLVEPAPPTELCHAGITTRSDFWQFGFLKSAK